MMTHYLSLQHILNCSGYIDGGTLAFVKEGYGTFDYLINIHCLPGMKMSLMITYSCSDDNKLLSLITPVILRNCQGVK